MTDIVAKLYQNRESEKKVSVSRYREILHSADDPDLDEVKQILQILEKTVEDFEADLAIVNKVKELESTATGLGIHTSSLKAKGPALREYDAETARIQAERQAGHNQLASEIESIRGKIESAKSAASKIESLKASRKGLFAS